MFVRAEAIRFGHARRSPKTPFKRTPLAGFPSISAGKEAGPAASRSTSPMSPSSICYNLGKLMRARSQTAAVGVTLLVVHAHNRAVPAVLDITGAAAVFSEAPHRRARVKIAAWPPALQDAARRIRPDIIARRRIEHSDRGQPAGGATCGWGCGSSGWNGSGGIGNGGGSTGSRLGTSRSGGRGGAGGAWLPIAVRIRFPFAFESRGSAVWSPPSPA